MNRQFVVFKTIRYFKETIGFGLVCKTSSFVSHQTRSHNKRISIKGYSTPRNFSCIEYCKLNIWSNIFEAFFTSYKLFSTQSPVAFGVLSSAYTVWVKSSNTLISAKSVRWLYTNFYFANYVWKLLPWTVSKD